MSVAAVISSAGPKRAGAACALALALAAASAVATSTTAAAASQVSYAATTVSVGTQPDSIAVVPSLHRAYVGSGDGSTLTVIDTGTRSVVGVVPDMGNGPHSLAVDTLPTTLVKASASGAAVEADADPPARAAIISPIVATHPTLYVASALDQSVAVVDASTNTVKTRIHLDETQPQALAVDTSTHTLYAVGNKAGSPFEGEISVIDESTNTVKANVTTSTPYNGAAIDTGNHQLFPYECCGDFLDILAGPTATQVTTVAVPGPAGIAVDSVKHLLYVSDGGDNAGNVQTFDEATRSVSASSPVGKESGAVALDSTLGLLYVANVDDETVSVVDIAKGAATVTVPVGVFPAAVAVDPTTHTAYVANENSNTVSVITRTVTGPVARLSGPDRLATAIAVSNAEYAPAGASAVVLARGDDYPDALVGAPLATAKHAPLLLTVGSTLAASTLTEIERVLSSGKTVYILGGTSAVPAGVESQLTGAGYQVIRYAGASRFATAVKVADALGDPGTVLLATGVNFPDALSAGVAAAKAGGVVLLTQGSTLPTETKNYLAAHPGTVYAVGGPAAAADPTATAIAGADRYQTAVQVAQRFFPTPTTIGLATGLAFPDALAGGPLLGADGAPLILVAPDTVPSSVTSYLGSVKTGVTRAFLFGGTNTVSTATESAINEALG